MFIYLTSLFAIRQSISFSTIKLSIDGDTTGRYILLSQQLGFNAQQYATYFVVYFNAIPLAMYKMNEDIALFFL